MENTNETNDSSKVSVGLRIDADLFAVVSDLAVKEDRTVANMIQRLLKTNPQIEPLLTAEPAAAAGN